MRKRSSLKLSLSSNKFCAFINIALLCLILIDLYYDNKDQYIWWVWLLLIIIAVDLMDNILIYIKGKEDE